MDHLKWQNKVLKFVVRIKARLVYRIYRLSYLWSVYLSVLTLEVSSPSRYKQQLMDDHFPPSHYLTLAERQESEPNSDESRQWSRPNNDESV